MLMNLRNALMAGKKLPYDNEVEYLESTGDQYINTGVTPDDDATFVICAAFTDLSTGRFGAAQVVGATYRYYFGVSNGKWIGAINSTNYNHNISQADTGIHIFKTNSLGLYIDDVMVVAAENSKPTIPVYLANINVSSTAIPTKAKLCSCKIYDANGVLIHDFIPVRKGTVGYLYDRVSGKLFGNAGTGDFVLGPDVVPVEWLGSSGTEWIDTGLAWDSLKWECIADITATNAVNENYIISQYGSGQGVVYAFVYMTDTYVRLAYNSNTAGSREVSSDFFGTKHIWHAIYESGNQKLDIGDDIHLLATQSYVAGQSDSAMRIIIGGMRTFGGKAAGIRFGNVIINHDSSPSRSFHPVRVGTGSTWEGAMMDVLTRRIYRNAGTGAFTYGNDLKYPIPAE